MATLTQEQFNQLKQKGLSEKKIKLLARQRGLEIEKPKTDLLKKTESVVGNIFPGRKLGQAIGRSISGLTGLATGDTERFRREAQANKASMKETIADVGAAALFAGTSGLGAGGGTLARTGKFAGTGASLGALTDISEGGSGIGGAITGGVVGGALPLAGGVARGTGRVVGGTFKNLAAGLTGKGRFAIDQVLENPQAALEGISGDSFEVLSRNAGKIRSSVSKLSKEASDEFGEALENLPKRLGRTPKITKAGDKTTIKVGGNTITLSLQGVKSKLTQALRQFDVEVNPRSKRLNFSEAPLDTAESKRLQEVLDVVNTWKDTTPRGFHKLARKISNFRKPGEQSRELNAIIDTVSRNARDYIGDRVPQAREMLQKYGQAQDVIDALNQEFRTAGRRLGGVAERIKTEQSLQGVFSGDKPSRVNLLRNLPEGQDIISQEAGRQLGQGVTRAGSSLGDFLRTAVNTVISPELVGQVVARTGIASQNVKPLLEALQKLTPAESNIIIRLLVGEEAE